MFATAREGAALLTELPQCLSSVDMGRQAAHHLCCPIIAATAAGVCVVHPSSADVVFIEFGMSGTDSRRHQPLQAQHVGCDLTVCADKSIACAHTPATTVNQRRAPRATVLMPERSCPAVAREASAMILYRTSDEV